MSDNLTSNATAAAVPTAHDPHNDVFHDGVRTRSRSGQDATVFVSDPMTGSYGEDDDIFNVNLSEYLDDLYESETKVDRTGLEDRASIFGQHKQQQDTQTLLRQLATPPPANVVKQPFCKGLCQTRTYLRIRLHRRKRLQS